MTVKVVDQKNLAAGMLFLLLGGAVAAVSWGYSLGTPRRMGPGFFPLGVGAALVLVGLIVLAGALRSAKPSTLGPVRLNAILFVLLAVVAFAFLLKSMGMLIASVALIAISAFANPRRSWPMVLASIAVLVPLCWLIFVALLGLRLRVLPPFLGVPW